MRRLLLEVPHFELHVVWYIARQRYLDRVLVARLGALQPDVNPLECAREVAERAHGDRWDLSGALDPRTTVSTSAPLDGCVPDGTRSSSVVAS